MDNIDLAELLKKIYQKLVKEVNAAYHNGNLDEILKKYELEDEVEHFYYDANNSKIIAIGDSRVNKNEMEIIAKKI